MQKTTTGIIQPVLVRDQVYQHLRKGMQSGQFPPGSRMNEVELATWLGVSRTPLRESLNRLAAEGFLEAKRGSGFVVILPSERDIAEKYAIRAILGGGAARLAAENITSVQLLALRRNCEESRRALSDAHAEKRLFDLFTRFHEILHEATGNRALGKLIDDLRGNHFVFQGTIVSNLASRRRTHDDHEQLLGLLEARDADGAARLAEQHVLLERDAMLQRRSTIAAGDDPTEAEQPA